MRKFLSIALSLIMVLTLMPAFTITASAAYATGTFTKVETVNDLTAGSYYVLYGISGTYTGALTAAASINRPKATAVTITAEGTIVNPELDIVWLLGGSTDAWTLYNENKDRYCEITANSTSGFAMNQTAATAYTVSVDASEGFRFISNHASANGRGISLYQTDFRPYALSSMNTLHLYKYTPSTTPTDPPAGQIDYTDLQAKIDEATALFVDTNTSADGSNIAFNAYWATDAAMTAISEAIGYAELWLEESPVTQQDITDATTELDGKLTTFTAARSLGSDYSSVGDIAAAKALAEDTATSVKGWVTYRYGNDYTIMYTVIEDYSGTGDTINGLVVYDALNFKIGDYVVLSGTIDTFGERPQLTAVTYSAAITAPVGETAPEVQIYANWAAANANAAELYDEYVCINDVILGTYSTTYTTHTSNGEEFTMYSGVQYNGVFSENNSTAAGDLVNLYGVFSAYNSVTRMRVGTPKNYEASQTVITYPLSIGTVTNGTLLVEDANGNEVVSGTDVAHGTELTITATPDTNCYLTSLQVNGEDFTNGGVFTVTSSTSITATFAVANTYTVTLKAGTETYDTLTYVEGNAALDLPTPNNVGEYSFVGWASGIVTNTTTEPAMVLDPYTPTTDITLFAVYVKTAQTGSTGYVLTAAADMTAGTYIIGTLRSSTATDDFYFANTTISSGDKNDMETNATATTIEADVDGVRSITELPAGAVEFTFAGNNTAGYTISPKDSTTYLGWTSYASRKLAWGAYSGTTWVPVANDEPLLAGGLHLVGDYGTDSPYTISENSTAVGAIRGYANDTQYRAIYLFKKTECSASTYTTSPVEDTYAVTLATGDGFTMAAATGYSTVVDKNDDFHFTFDLDTGYSNSTPVISAGEYTVNRVGETNEYYIENVTSEVTLTVTGIVLNTYTLNITVVGGDYGTVTVFDGVDTITDGATITHGDSLEISVAPNEATTQKVVSFTVNGVNKTETATQVVESDVNVNVTFALKEIYTVDFMNRGAAYGVAQTIYEGGAATLPAELGTVGEYTFIGWMGEMAGYDTDNPVRPTIYTTSFVPAEDTTLVAVYTTNVASGSAGWASSDSNFTDGDKYIIAGLYNREYYALKYDASSVAITLDSVDDSNIAWIASAQTSGTTSGTAFNEQVNTGNYLHMNSGALKSAATVTNGIFTFFSAGTDDNSYSYYKMTRSDGERWMHFENGNFSVTASESEASNIYFFKYSDGTADMYTVLPTAPASAAPVTVGMAAKTDHTAIRIAGRLSFSDLQTLSVGDRIDYGFNLNIYDSENSAPMAANWATRSAASLTAGGFVWTEAMDTAATTADLVAAIRAAGYKVYDYNDSSIIFMLVINGLSENGTGAASCENLWMFEAYTTVSSVTLKGAIKYNSANGVLTNTPSGIYVA